MLSKSLYIMTMVDGKEVHFPVGRKAARLGQYTYTAQRMGSTPTLTASLMYDSILDADCWTGDEFVDFNGERYYIQNAPSFSKDNSTLLYKHDITFVSERIALENEYFYDVVTDSTEAEYADRYRSNQTEFSFMGDIKEFVARLNDSLAYTKLYDPATGAGYHIVIDDGITSEIKEVSFSDKIIAEAIQEINTTYELAYYFVGHVCHVGYTQNVIPTPFEYGREGGLLKISVQNANSRIVDRITGSGGTENIPYYYPNDTAEGVPLYSVENIASGDVQSVSLSTIHGYAGASDGVTFTLCKHTPSSASKSFSASDSKSETTTYTGEMPETYTAGQKLELDTIYAQAGDVIKLTSASTTLKASQNSGERERSSQTIKYYIRKSNVFGSADLVDTNGNLVGGNGIYEIVVGSTVTIPSNGKYIIGVVVQYQISVDRSYNGSNWIKFDLSSSIAYTQSHEYESLNFAYGDGNIIGYTKSGILLANAESQNATQYMSSYVEGQGFVETIVDGSTDNAAKITINGRKWILPTGKLMPSIYRESGGGERYYNAEDDKYKDDSGNYYTFNNKYIEGRPHAGIENFDDIYPTIRNIKNEDGVLIGSIADIAFDSDDNDDTKDSGDNAEYVHSYFYVKLNIFNGIYGFNLFDQATENDEAKFSMTSGNCAACTFELGVIKQGADNGTRYIFKNPVQVDNAGNIVSGSYSDKVKTGNYQDIQQNTQTHSVWVALKKEVDTFGIVMPNATNNYKPSVGDTFVITGIKMPDVYVREAESRLDAALIKYMKENNDQKFNFSINFSRIYLENNPIVADMINENARLSIRYNDKDVLLYVTNYAVKADGNILNEITVELADEVNVSQNQLTLKLNEAKADILSNLPSVDVLSVARRYFLRRDIPDTTPHSLGVGSLHVGSTGAGFSAEGKAYAEELCELGGTTGGSDAPVVTPAAGGGGTLGQLANMDKNSDYVPRGNYMLQMQRSGQMGLAKVEDVLGDTIDSRLKKRTMTMANYEAMDEHDPQTDYWITDTEGEVAYWFRGDQLLGKRGTSAEAASQGFPYTFPIIFS